MKQLSTIIKVLLIGMLLSAGCCDNKFDGQEYIYIVNKSSVDIRCQLNWPKSIPTADTLYRCQKIPFKVQRDSIYLHPSGNWDRGLGWEYDFKSNPYIQFLIMDDTIHHQYFLEPCDTIRKYVPILHHYELTLEDLQRMNWTVVYPPGE